MYEHPYDKLNEMVLDKNGFLDSIVLVCTKCHSSLVRKRIPKSSLANDLYIGNYKYIKIK